MSIRTLALALLAGVSLAQAAPPRPPHSTPTKTEEPADTIDVDAMARAKDVGESAAESSQTVPRNESSAPEPAESDRGNPQPSSEASLPPEDSAIAAKVQQESEARAPTSESDASAAAATSAPPAQAATSQAPASAASRSEDAPPATSVDSQAVSIAAACESRAASLLDNVEKSAFAAATADFDAPMRSALPAPKLKEAWDSLARFGRLNARGQSHLGTAEGYTVVMIPLIFDKANLVAQIACGSDGRVAGFHVTPAPKPQF